MRCPVCQFDDTMYPSNMKWRYFELKENIYGIREVVECPKCHVIRGVD